VLPCCRVSSMWPSTRHPFCSCKRSSRSSPERESSLTITLAPALTADDFTAAVLRSRVAKAPRMSTIHLFRAMAGEVELALVVLDIHEASDSVILYELFLCSERRNRGVGTKVLAAIEEYAKGSGRACLEVWPRS